MNENFSDNSDLGRGGGEHDHDMEIAEYVRPWKSKIKVREE